MSQQLVCLNCGNIGKPKWNTKGSIVIELILWLMFIFPGLIYSCWRISSRSKICSSCESPNLVPVNSPKGREITGNK